MKKIIVAPDSFKGSLSSIEVATIIEEVICNHNSNIIVEALPLADGGEGTAEIFASKGSWKRIPIETYDPLLRKINSDYLFDSQNIRAFIESAKTLGLPLLTKDERNPMNTSSYGLGKIIKDALEKGCRKVVVSLGGSAVCDGGIGMLDALGFRFLDSQNHVLAPIGGSMGKIVSIDSSNIVPGLEKIKFSAVCDVTNPLFGEKGAAKIFAPQKGATKEDVEYLDKGLINLSKVALKNGIVSVDKEKSLGAGAAGGLGYAIMGFLNGEYISGINFILDIIDFHNKVKNADLIITGEGRIDRQSLMGKVINGILRISEKEKIPVIAIGGSIESPEYLKSKGFLDLYSISNPALSLIENMQKDVATSNLRRVVRKMISSHKEIFAE